MFRWLAGLLLVAAAALANTRLLEAALIGATSPPFGVRIVSFAQDPGTFVGLFVVRLLFALLCDGLLLLAVRNLLRARRTAKASVRE